MECTRALLTTPGVEWSSRFLAGGRWTSVFSDLSHSDTSQVAARPQWAVTLQLPDGVTTFSFFSWASLPSGELLQ